MEKFNTKKIILTAVILLITILLWVFPTADLGIEGMNVMQQRTLAIFVFAALMWLFEVIPAWATSVTTIVALLFAVSDKGFVLEEHGVAVSYREIMASFADPVIMLFLGGFVLAIAANKVGLDAYLARTLLRVFGSKPKFVLLGLLLVPGTFSMFMSNTATAAMMLAFGARHLLDVYVEHRHRCDDAGFYGAGAEDIAERQRRSCCLDACNTYRG